jgi:hypothetical protein
MLRKSRRFMLHSPRPCSLIQAVSKQPPT